MKKNIIPRLKWYIFETYFYPFETVGIDLASAYNSLNCEEKYYVDGYNEYHDRWPSEDEYEE